MSIENADLLPLEIPFGWMNAAGTLGFIPPTLPQGLQPPIAFVTNPISEHHRLPAGNRTMVPFPGGLLVHTGWPNPGFRQTIKQFSSFWARTRIPVWVHLLPETVNGAKWMIRQLEDMEGVQAVEISFPEGEIDNGIPGLIEATLGELPIILNLTVSQLRESWVSAGIKSGLHAVSLGAPRGKLPDGFGGWVTGRLYGPAVIPFHTKAIEIMKQWGLPVIYSGGIIDLAQIEAARSLGAAAVQLDTILWRNEPGSWALRL